MKKRKLLLNVAVVVGLGALSGQSWAGCSISGGTMASEVTIPDITVPPDAPIGTLLLQYSVPYVGQRKMPCTDRIYDALRYATSRTVVSASGVPAGVYSNNVPGVGVKVTWMGSDFAKTGWPWSFYNGAAGQAVTYTVKNSNYKILFYKTGAITPGELEFPRNFVERWYSTSPSTSGGVRVYTLNVLPIKVKNPSCETPNLTVNLGKHAKTDFGGVGSTSSETPFDLALNNCSPGMTAVKFTFKPEAGITLVNSGTAAQHLSLKSDSTASGVGVQVLYQDGTLIPFKTANSIPLLSPGYNASTGGSFTVPMKARYIQTASTVSGGTANSAAGVHHDLRVN